MKVTVSALRDIDKVGGLDEYLLKESFQSVLGEKGRELRQRILIARNAGHASTEGQREKITSNGNQPANIRKIDKRVGTETHKTKIQSSQNLER